MYEILKMDVWNWEIGYTEGEIWMLLGIIWKT